MYRRTITIMSDFYGLSRVPSRASPKPVPGSSGAWREGKADPRENPAP